MLLELNLEREGWIIKEYSKIYGKWTLNDDLMKIKRLNFIK